MLKKILGITLLGTLLLPVSFAGQQGYFEFLEHPTLSINASNPTELQFPGDFVAFGMLQNWKSTLQAWEWSCGAIASNYCNDNELLVNSIFITELTNAVLRHGYYEPYSNGNLGEHDGSVNSAETLILRLFLSTVFSHPDADYLPNNANIDDLSRDLKRIYGGGNEFIDAAERLKALMERMDLYCFLKNIHFAKVCINPQATPAEFVSRLPYIIDAKFNNTTNDPNEKTRLVVNFGGTISKIERTDGYYESRFARIIEKGENHSFETDRGVIVRIKIRPNMQPKVLSAFGQNSEIDNKETLPTEIPLNSESPELYLDLPNSQNFSNSSSSEITNASNSNTDDKKNVLGQ